MDQELKITIRSPLLGIPPVRSSKEN